MMIPDMSEHVIGLYRVSPFLKEKKGMMSDHELTNDLISHLQFGVNSSDL